VLGGGGCGRTEDGAVPSGEDATGCTNCRPKDTGIEAAWEERVSLKEGDSREFGFLEKDDIRDRRKQFREDVTTLNWVIETSNIPSKHPDASIH
jgi:hypothetical protein